MNITRDLAPFIRQDIKEKIVMLGGPRQVGKTTLAKRMMTSKSLYLNWDVLDHRAVLKSHQIDPAVGMVVLDEIHKYRRWRMLVKGLYDQYQGRLKIMVTGSAKLDHFRKGGDSLFGRFFYYRLHPLTMHEVDKQCTSVTLQKLMDYGGFPEPFIKKNKTFHRRWLKERKSRVVYQDVQDLSLVKDISNIELLVDLLPSRVGSLLSIRSLQEDLEVSPNTVANWVQLLEKVYYCYRIMPYGPSKIRAVKKAQKLFLWDWSEIELQGPRYENMVASHLLKYCHRLEDTEGHTMELRYLKDTDGREIDFVVIQNKKPLFAVECKTGEKHISKHMFYFRDRTKVPQFYQVHQGQKTYQDGNIMVLPFKDLCKQLKL